MVAAKRKKSFGARLDRFPRSEIDVAQFSWEKFATIRNQPNGLDQCWRAKVMKMILLRIPALFVALFLLATEPSMAQTLLQRVRIAYSSSGVNYIDLFLSKEKGYFREEGLEPQLVQM